MFPFGFMKPLIKKLRLPLSFDQIRSVWRWIFFGAVIGVVSGFGAIFLIIFF